MRALGLIKDPKPGGTTLEERVTGKIVIPKPTLWVPVTSATVDPKLAPVDRKTEVRGRRGEVSPQPFASMPQLTIEGKAYPEIIVPLMSACLGGTITTGGGPLPKILEESVVPTLENNAKLPAYIAWLIREEQLDQMTGCIVSELEIDLPIDGEGTFKAVLEGNFQQVSVTGSQKEVFTPFAAGEAVGTPEYSGFDTSYTLRDTIAKVGAAETPLTSLAGIKWTFNNGIITDFRSTHRPGTNVFTVEILPEKVNKKVWYPNQYKLGPQTVTMTIDLNTNEAAMEQRHIFQAAEKFIINAGGGPALTTPEAEEKMEIVMGLAAPTGGGAEPVKREGDQYSSFEWTGYVNEAGTEDVKAKFASKTKM